MRRTLIVVSLVVAGIFGSGYLLGQLTGLTSANAAPGHLKPLATGTQVPGSGTRFPGGGTPHADGKVVSVSGNTITVQADNDPAGSTEYTGVTTIVLTNATTYEGNSARAAIVAGAYIIAEGTVSADGKTLTATTVGVGGPGGHRGPGGHGGFGGHGGPHADGTVTAVNGSTVTIKADADPAGSQEYSKVTTVLLTSATTFEGTTTRASIVVGANIDAEGTLSADGLTLTATNVGVRGSDGPPHA